MFIKAENYQNEINKKRDTLIDVSLLTPAKPFTFGFRPFP